MKPYTFFILSILHSIASNAQNSSEVKLDSSDSNTIIVRQAANDTSNDSKVEAKKSKGNKVAIDQKQSAPADSIANKKPKEKSITDYVKDSDTIFKAVISLLTIGTLLFAFRDRFKVKKKKP